MRKLKTKSMNLKTTVLNYIFKTTHVTNGFNRSLSINWFHKEMAVNVTDLLNNN